ncbi:hypothetical protein TgHK011_004692 [Trichoderma gracile]|nr:hypothetical protein TgHK011_004692 [Trichoderma gracile]
MEELDSPLEKTSRRPIIWWQDERALDERERLAYTSNNTLLLTSGSSWMEQENEATTSKRFPGAHSWMSPQLSGSVLSWILAELQEQHNAAWHGRCKL